MAVTDNEKFIGVIVVLRLITRAGAVLADLFFVPYIYQGEEIIDPNQFEDNENGGSPKKHFNPEGSILWKGIEKFQPGNQKIGYNTVPNSPFTQDDVEVCNNEPIFTMAYPIYMKTVGLAESILASIESWECFDFNDSYQLEAITKLINFCSKPDGEERKNLLSPYDLMVRITQLVTSRIAQAKIPQIIPLGKSEFDFHKPAVKK